MVLQSTLFVVDVLRACGRTAPALLLPSGVGGAIVEEQWSGSRLGHCGHLGPRLDWTMFEIANRQGGR